MTQDSLVYNTICVTRVCVCVLLLLPEVSIRKFSLVNCVCIGGGELNRKRVSFHYVCVFLFGNVLKKTIGL